jgi:hypothetical protein
MTDPSRREEVCLPFWRRAWRALFWSLAGAAGTLAALARFRADEGEPPAAVPLPRSSSESGHEQESKPPEEIRRGERIEHPSVHHDPRDVRVGCVFAVMGFAICFAALHYFAVWRYYDLQRDKQSPSPYPLQPHPSRALPPAPRLEPLDRMAEFEASNVFVRRAARERRLHGYGPTREEGYVHIPIEQAMQQLAGELPVREEPPPAPIKSHGLVTGGESNSGRMFRGVSR